MNVAHVVGFTDRLEILGVAIFMNWSSLKGMLFDSTTATDIIDTTSNSGGQIVHRLLCPFQVLELIFDSPAKSNEFIIQQHKIQFLYVYCWIDAFVDIIMREYDRKPFAQSLIKLKSGESLLSMVSIHGQWSETGSLFLISKDRIMFTLLARTISF